MGICGITVKPGGRPIESATLEAMVSSLVMTKDDVRQHIVAGSIALGAVSGTRSTLLFSSDTAIVICDADLYNTQELRGEASSWQSGTPAELIAVLYQKYGQSFPSRLRGVFAIAIWDKRSQSLLLVRDRFGVKPLCYAATAEEIIFASQPRAIFECGRFARKVNSSAILHYLNYHVVPAPETAYEGMLKVLPGECLVWKNGVARAQRYWDLQYTEDARASENQLATELLARMEEGVRVTSADVSAAKTGCFLSGGTDSSSVVGLLTRSKREPANTFSIGFQEGRFNELDYAHTAVRHFGALHHEAIIGPQHAYDAIPKIVEAYDEPFSNSSAIPTYACAKLARDHGIEALLAGDGGDELFGGNERYRTNQVFDIYHAVPRAIRAVLEPAVFATPEVSVLGKAQRYIRRSKTPNPERYCQWHLLQVFSPDEVLGPAMPHVNGDLLAIMRGHYQSAPAKSELNRLLYIDIKMTLGDEDLPKVVRTAEMAGINVRFPYLDHPLADFSGRLPASLKVRGLEKRYLFKKATRNLLPEAILKKKKHGFGLPMGLWLKTDPRIRAMGREVLLDPRTYQRGYFRREFIEQLMAKLEQDNTPYYGDLLWIFFMLELWHRRHVEGAALGAAS